jgi:hypothetical protein
MTAEAMSKTSADRCLYRLVKIAAERIRQRMHYNGVIAMTAQLNKAASYLPLVRQAPVRTLQRELAAGISLATSIKTAYPHLNGLQRSFLASRLVRATVKAATLGGSPGMGAGASMATTQPMSATMPMPGSMSAGAMSGGSVNAAANMMKAAEPWKPEFSPETHAYDPNFAYKKVPVTRWMGAIKGWFNGQPQQPQAPALPPSQLVCSGSRGSFAFQSRYELAVRERLRRLRRAPP